MKVFRVHLVLIFLTLHSCTRGDNVGHDIDQYEYSIRREALKEAEMTFQGKVLDLSQKEQVVDHYLNYLKWEEFEATLKTGFPPSRPIEEVLDHIKASDVYRVLKPFPKGGMLHTHLEVQLSMKILIDVLWDSNELEHLYILPDNHTSTPWKLDFFINPPASEPWIQVKHHRFYTKERIHQHLTLMGILSKEAKQYPTDEAIRWRLTQTLFFLASNVFYNKPIRKRYMELIYQTCMEEGIIYLESRLILPSGPGIYVLDEAPQYQHTNGKKYVDTSDNDLEITLSKDTLKKFKSRQPFFVDHRIILIDRRRNSQGLFEQMLQKFERLVGRYPDHVIGFDISGYEDGGYSDIYHLDEILHQQNSDGKLQLYFHAAETKYPNDLMVSTLEGDPVGAGQNIYEAILLGSRRIGHGYGALTKHPYLVQLMQEHQVALEVCPVSGQILGYFPDLRTHPALSFFRSGGKVVLGSDDAGIFGYDFFTVDWYEVFMAWGLDLIDLRQLALNSIYFSSMSDVEKTGAVEHKWKPLWDTYIDSIHTEACQAELNQSQPTFVKILPKIGPYGHSFNVSVFGKHFEQGICKEHLMKCRFGSYDSGAVFYRTNQELACQTPVDAQPGLQFLSITFDGKKFYDTGLSITFTSFTHINSKKPAADSRAKPVMVSLAGYFTLLTCFCLLVVLLKKRFA